MMTTEDFERAQLRLDIEEVERKRHDRLRPPEGDLEVMREHMQAYFERRD